MFSVQRGDRIGSNKWLPLMQYDAMAIDFEKIDDLSIFEYCCFLLSLLVGETSMFSGVWSFVDSGGVHSPLWSCPQRPLWQRWLPKRPDSPVVGEPGKAEN